jgi:hypothetical protein
MATPTPHFSYFLAEWYRPELSEGPVEPTAARVDEAAASLSATGSPVQLLAMLAVPTDEVLFGIFAAASANDVAQTCDRAGISAQRLTPASGAHIRGLIGA